MNLFVLFPHLLFCMSSCNCWFGPKFLLFNTVAAHTQKCECRKISTYPHKFSFIKTILSKNKLGKVCLNSLKKEVLRSIGALVLMWARTTDAQWSLFSLTSRTVGLEPNSGIFGVFSAKLSAPILVQWVPCPCFPLFHHHFYKKLSLYIYIANIYLGLGFEFGPNRIRDLAFVCP